MSLMFFAVLMRFLNLNCKTSTDNDEEEETEDMLYPESVKSNYFNLLRIS